MVGAKPAIRRGKPGPARDARGPTGGVFSPAEKEYLRDRLFALERRPEGLHSGLPLRRDGAGSLRMPSALASMVARGFLENSPPPSRAAMFTECGVDALKSNFSSQPIDFGVLFPRLHAQLDLSVLLKKI